jgi:hypothetical protein
MPSRVDLRVVVLVSGAPEKRKCWQGVIRLLAGVIDNGPQKEPAIIKKMDASEMGLHRQERQKSLFAESRKR